MLTRNQRLELETFLHAELNALALSDEELLSHAAARLGLRGSVTWDPDGILEVVRGAVLVGVEALGPDDAADEEYPDNLRLSVYIDSKPELHRKALESAGILDAEEHAFQPDEKWLHAWWGAAVLRLKRDAELVDQLRALGQAMDEAERVVVTMSWKGFTDNLSSILLE